jgi:hypothetical protein
MTAQRPKVFVSSTIYDFADLRDALKFWLEEMGFDVQMSEFNDFERRPEAGTFDACFDSIRQSDYYVLLVGDRPGSWYDEPNKTSVTQQEYRVAHEWFQRTARPKIVSFVRTRVVVALRERDASNTPANAGSTMQDPEWTRHFISEVRREQETEAASAGRGSYPLANWLTGFAAFRELTDGLRSALRIKGPLPRAAILENLRHELEFNLRLTLIKHDSQPFYRHCWLDKIREEVQLSRQELKAERWLTHTQIKHAMIYAETGTVPRGDFLCGALGEAVLSGALLHFDPERDRYVASPLLEALYQLRQEIDLYKSRYPSDDDRQRWVSYWFTVKDQENSRLPVPVHYLLSLFGLHDTQHNIVRLLVGILRYLYSHTESIEVMLRPTTPLIGEEERIRAESVSEEELRAWLDKDNPYLLVGLRDYSREDRQRLQDALRAAKDAVGQDEFARIMRQAIAKSDDSILQGFKEALGEEEFETIMAETLDELESGEEPQA